MIGVARQSVLLVLVLGTVAAQTLCACPNRIDAKHAAAQAVRQGCTGTRKCCVRTEKPQPERGPCQGCNLMHRLDQAQPDRQDAIAAHLPSLALVPLPIIYDNPASRFAVESDIRDRVPIPPLLTDLFHCGTLLLV